MSSDHALIYLRWLCRELVNALLRPVWLRYVAKLDAGGWKVAETYFRRFTRLVDAAPCWPCRIEYSKDGPLWITTGEDERDEMFEDYLHWP